MTERISDQLSTLTNDEDGIVEVSKTRSQLAEALILVDGKPFSLEHYPMFRAIYDTPYASTLLMTSRQVGKSTTLSTFSIAESIALPFFRTYFISPSQEQTHKFSTLRVGKMITFSPSVRENYVDTATEGRVNLRMFRNGSEIAFSYAMDDADRCRGYSCDRLALDEIQDMLLDVVEPVVRECLNKSPYKYMMRCGTPKTLEHNIHEYWQVSTQTEWMMKCSGCSKYNFVRSTRSIGKKGPICTHCGTYLNPRHGRWVDMNPGLDKNGNPKIKGFHISQPMAPECVPACWTSSEDIEKAQTAWNEVLDKMSGPKPYSEAMFLNEVLGISFSLGTRFLTRDDLEACCDGPVMSMKPGLDQLKGVLWTVAGVDWSGGGANMTSRTVVWVIGRMASKRYRSLYYEVFSGTDPIADVEKIASILGMMPNMKAVVCDAGEGNMNTEMLRKKFDRKRVWKVRYGDPKYHIKWDGEGNHYYVNRTWAIDSLMTAIKCHEFQFSVNKESMTTAFDDILNEYIHITQMKKKVWRNSPTKPDDCMHALNFARIAAQLIANELDLTSEAPKNPAPGQG